MRMYKLEQDIMEELYEENVRSNCGVKRLVDTIVNYYFKEYLDEIVEQLEKIEVKRSRYSESVECNLGTCYGTDCYECIVSKVIEIVKGGAK